MRWISAASKGWAIRPSALLLQGRQTELLQHHIRRLQRAFDPPLGVRVRFAADVHRHVGVRLDDALLDLRTADADVPTVPASAERIVAPIAEGGVADVRRVVQAVDEAKLP